jgi:hypothetical protein
MKCVIDRDEFWPCYSLKKTDTPRTWEMAVDATPKLLARYEAAYKEFLAVNNLLDRKYNAARKKLAETRETPESEREK